jgi:NADH-ubiquinone oxidoreductase chain 5
MRYTYGANNVNITSMLPRISDSSYCSYVDNLFTSQQFIAKCDTTVVCAFLLLAAIGKSAQAGLHIWLPEAMEGPTPVSSLIHAATMVTAGIFLLVRCSYFFSETNTLLVMTIFFGSVTAFFASTIGLLQSDLKKVVSYSTCSQLGYMFVCCGFTAYGNSMYHLFNHAFFKALLFLTAGYIIHAISNEQDIRKMGGLINVLPYHYLMMLIGSLSLMGFPFLSGFYSKDKIIELCFNYYINSTDSIASYKYVIFSQSLCLVAVIFTIIYSAKLIFYIFLNSFNGFRRYAHNIHFASIFIQFPLFILSILSIISGYLTSDMMVGVGTDFWSNSIRSDTFIIKDISIYKSFFQLHTEYNHYIRQITLI